MLSSQAISITSTYMYVSLVCKLFYISKWLHRLYRKHSWATHNSSIMVRKLWNRYFSSLLRKKWAIPPPFIVNNEVTWNLFRVHIGCTLAANMLPISPPPMYTIYMYIYHYIVNKFVYKGVTKEARPFPPLAIAF